MRAWSYALTGTFGAGEFLLVLFVWLVYGKPDFGTMVQVSVAVGTGSLALAAVIGVAFEWDRRTADQANRLHDRAPHIELFEKTVTVPRAEILRIPPSLHPGQFDTRRLILRNNGPGIATRFDVTQITRRAEAFVLRDREDEDWQVVDSPRNLKDETDVEVLDRTYLAPGEEVEVMAPDFWLQSPDPTTPIPIAIFYIVRATDLEGNPATPTSGGLRFSPPTLAGRAPDDEIEWDREFHASRSRWHFIDDLGPLPKGK